MDDDDGGRGKDRSHRSYQRAILDLVVFGMDYLPHGKLARWRTHGEPMALAQPRCLIGRLGSQREGGSFHVRGNRYDTPGESELC